MDRATRRGRRIAAVMLAGLALTATACSSGSKTEEASQERPARVVEAEGGGTPAVVLAEDAARRLGVQTAAVTAGRGGTEIRYAAVLYDPDGNTWTFVNDRGFTYRRAPIKIARIDGDTVLLTSGPRVGTKVVTVGAAEIYGAELGVGDDE
jgi:hypothetical protein